MACGSCGSKNRVAGGGQLVGYAITYRDGTKEDVMSTDLAAVRRKITLKGGGTHRPIVSPVTK